MICFSLYTGIGGFDLAAEAMGWEVRYMCEINKQAQSVLTQRFPNAILLHDAKKVNGYEYRRTIDLVYAGIPCQPFSHAGLRRGTEDERYEWDEMFRIIREIQPTWVCIENVYGLYTQSGGMVLENICTDLELLGYEVQSFIIPAAAVGAPHRRDRIWILAENSDFRTMRKQNSRNGRESYGNISSAIQIRATDQTDLTNAQSTGRKGQSAITQKNFPEVQRFERRITREQWNEHWYEAATRICGMDDGIS